MTKETEMKKRLGTVSYNMYCNFTNYGSALQTWALHQAIKKVAGDTVEPVLVDYCPDILQDKDPLNPFANMWDKDEESQRMCELTMPAAIGRGGLRRGVIPSFCEETGCTSESEVRRRN